MWTVEFLREQETIGTLTAYFNKGQADEFAFKYSVNLGDAGSVDDFIAHTKKEFQNKPSTSVDPKVTTLLDNIATTLNKEI